MHKKIPDSQSTVGENFLFGGEVNNATSHLINAPNLHEIFALEDEYCNTFHGNALDFYRKGANA